MKRKKRKVKKNVKIVILFLLLIIIILGVILMINFLKPNIFNDNLKVEVNDDVSLYDLIKKDEINNVESKDKKIDTSKLGEQTIKIKYKNKDISFKINVVDTTDPVIEGLDTITVTKGSKDEILSNASASDNSKEEIKVSIEGEYDLNKEGEYNLKYVATDSSGNTSEKDFVLKVVSLEAAPVSYTEYKDLKDGEYSTSKGYKLTIKDGVAYVDGYVIVNKTYSLPRNYKPVDPYSGSVTSGHCINCIDKTTMEAFKQMEADARSIGLNIYISSGYRSYDTQQSLYKNYSLRDGEAAADKYSARAGHSEHQTGYCYDLNTIDDSFAKTDEGIWINKNAYLYGFIIRYPKGKEDITGYQYESWHLRYVGVELAKKLYNDGDWITMEEYYGLSSKY